MKMNIRVVIAVVALLLSAQFGGTQSKQGKEKPDINVYGDIIDAQAKRTAVENITINGRIRDVPVYAIPAHEDMKPDANTTRLNLADICEIRTMSHKTYTFSKREYVEIKIMFNDPKRTTNNYIIDRRRKIFCDIDNGGAEMEVMFQAISRLLIKGVKPQLPHVGKKSYCYADEVSAPLPPQPMPAHPAAQPVAADDLKDEQIDLLVTKTHDLLDKLEGTAHALPDENKQERSLKTSILSTVQSIKDTIKGLFS